MTFQSSSPNSGDQHSLARFARYHDRPTRTSIFCLVLLVVCVAFNPRSAFAAVTWIQSNFAAPQTPQATVQVKYTSAQTAGNLNVVIVGWNDTTATVSSVTDTKGNSYVLAVGPTQLSGKLSQSIYYAKNILGATAGANTVTVNFAPAAAYPDIRVMEYSGIDTSNPLDVVVGATGTSATSSSGAVTTTNASDLLVAANMVQTSTNGAGTNFTSRVITAPDGDIAEDRVVAATGSYSATAPLSSSGGWVMQMAAFRAAGNPPPPPTQTTPEYIQSAYQTPQSPQTTVIIPYASPQAGGDLNVVIVGWNDTTAKVNSVTDTKGNSYLLAVGPTQLSGSLSQSIYYAKNIAAGTNSVTLTFSRAAAYPDIRVVEYRGIDSTNPVDVVQSASGTGAVSNSGNVTTTSPTDLLVGGNMVLTGTTGVGTNYRARQITTPDGDIAEDRVVTAVGSYNATAPLDSGGWVMQLVAFRAAAGQPDTTPPTVSVTAPASGATLTGLVNASVSASDTGTGVAGIQLQVDGVVIGTGAVTSPATFSLDTTKFANGTHSLTGMAWDFANNTAVSSSVSVTFSNANPGNPAQSGVWSSVVSLPVVAVHAALLPNGKIFMSDGMGHGSNAIDWNYLVNTADFVPAPVNIFCNGMDQMADGRLMIVGGHVAGHVGLDFAGIFDPSSESWVVLPSMAYPRWYPTLNILSDGHFLVTSGEMNGPEDDQAIPEIYNPSANSWSSLSSAPLPFIPVNYYYPHTLLLPDGRALVPGSTEDPIVSQVLDLNTLKWTSIGGPAVDGGSAAMYLPGKIIKTGTSNDTDNDAAGNTRNSASSAFVLDTTQPSPAWTPVAPMHFGRTYHCTTVLPDGNVLVTGGGSTTYPTTDFSTPVLAPELWSPATQNWTTLAPMSTPRLYHGVALLLPDARVWVSGGGRWPSSDQPTDQLSAEFFAPPYLFKGPRPTISSAPAQLSYGQNFTVQTPDASRIAKISLIRFGAVTHDFNTGEHFVPLTFTAGSGQLTVTAPANSNLAPPGNYMIFLADTNGVPSVAAIVHF